MSPSQREGCVEPFLSAPWELNILQRKWGHPREMGPAETQTSVEPAGGMPGGRRHFQKREQGRYPGEDWPRRAGCIWTCENLKEFWMAGRMRYRSLWIHTSSEKWPNHNMFSVLLRKLVKEVGFWISISELKPCYPTQKIKSITVGLYGWLWASLIMPNVKAGKAWWSPFNFAFYRWIEVQNKRWLTWNDSTIGGWC